MADHPDRDRSIDHLLRQARAGASSTPDGCLDAERLAAWSEGALRPGESTLVETHLADCARCQAMLAAFVESAPVTPAAVPFWQRWTTRWLVPVAAASAAVLVWAVITREPDPPATTMARMEQFEAPVAGAPSAQRPDAPPEPPRAAAPGAADAAAESPQPRTLVPSESQSAVADQALVSPGASAEPQPQSPPTAGAAARRDERAAAAEPARSSAPEAPRPAPAAASPSAPPAARQPASSATPAPGAPAPAAPPPSPVQVPATRPAAPTDPVGAIVTANPTIETQTGERSFSVGRAASGPAEIAGDFSSASSRPLADNARRDPNAPVDLGAPAPATSATAVTAGTASPPIRWRLMPDGRLARSADDGATWSVVAFDSPISIAAASAPSALVCWVVDSNGVVWRSTDGATFQRTPASVDAALVSVLATDAVQATVVADDGRVFITTDGGARWRELP